MFLVLSLICWHQEKNEKIEDMHLQRISFRRKSEIEAHGFKSSIFRYPRRGALGPRWNLPSDVDPGSFKLHKQQTSFIPPNASRLRAFRQNNDANG